MKNKITLTIWIVTIIVLIISTLVKTPIYDKWWFVIQLFVFAVSTFCDLYRLHKRIRPSVFALYISVLLILLGGFLTFTTSQNGNMHLTENESVNTFKIGENQIQIPFYVTLKSFDVVYYPGTMSHADYVSNVVITDDGNILKKRKISMNNILKHKGFRFFNEDFDKDMNGVTLTVQHDPWGITVTYIGYILMMISMLVLFIQKITTKIVPKSKNFAILLIMIMIGGKIFAPINIWQSY